MRIGIMSAAILALMSAASAEDYGHPTAFVVSPIHGAQIVRGDDGMDHVEYDLLLVSVLPEPVTLSSVTVLGPAGKELMRIEHPALAAVTQPLFARTKTRLSRGEILERMGLKGDKSGEMSVSNALTTLTKSNQVHREGGKYRATK